MTISQCHRNAAVWTAGLMLVLTVDLCRSRASESLEVFSDSKAFKVRIELMDERDVVASFYRLKASAPTMLWRTNLARVAMPFLGDSAVYIAPEGAGVAIENHSTPKGWVLVIFDVHGHPTFYNSEALFSRRAPSEEKPSPTLDQLSPEEVAKLSPADLALILAKQTESSLTNPFEEATGSLGFFDSSEGHVRFCLWVGMKNDWFAFDMATGLPFEPNAGLKSTWTERGRRTALRIIRAHQPSPSKDLWDGARSAVGGLLGPANQAGSSNWRQEERELTDAYRFVAALRRPEDRTIIEALLASEEFILTTGMQPNPSDGTERRPAFTLESPNRELGDRLLSQFKTSESRIPELGGIPGATEFRYLGNLSCSVELPFAADSGEVYVYLLPGREGKGQSRAAEAVETLRGSIASCLQEWGFMHHSVRPQPEVSNRAECAFKGLTPGSYRLKAVWARQPTATGNPRTNTIPQPGDYQSQESGPFEITAGGSPEEVTLVCTNRVGPLAQPYLADEPKIASWLAKRRAQQIDDEGGPLDKAAIKRSNAQKRWTPPPGIVKPDSPINLIGATYGPDPDMPALGPPENAADVLTVWWTDKPDKPNEESTKFYVMDDHGCHFTAPGVSQMITTSGDASVARSSMSFGSLPRRQMTFKFVVAPDGAPPVEFIIPNLAGQVTNTWTAGPVRDIRDLGDGSKVEFRGFLPGNRGVDVHVERNGQPDADWKVENYVVRDAMGNEARDVSGLECRKEAVIQVSVNLVRPPSAHFSEKELWTVSGLVVPAPGQFQALDQTQKLSGLSVQLLGISGIGETSYLNGQPVAATAQASPDAVPWRGSRHAGVIMESVCNWGRPRYDPLVFIRNAGLLMLGQDDDSKLQVVSKVPHLSVRLKGLRKTHRCNLAGNEIRTPDSAPISSLALRPADYAVDDDTYFLPLPEDARQGTVAVKLVVQKVRNVEWFTDNPAAQ